MKCQATWEAPRDLEDLLVVFACTILWALSLRTIAEEANLSGSLGYHYVDFTMQQHRTGGLSLLQKTPCRRSTVAQAPNLCAEGFRDPELLGLDTA